MNASRSPISWVNNSMAIPTRPGRTRKAIKRGPAQRIVEGKSFRLADEVRYIQRRAADRADQLAARLAREGENEPIHIEETDTTFAIGWTGRYRIEGAAFVYSYHDSGRVTTILGTRSMSSIRRLDREISNVFG